MDDKPVAVGGAAIAPKKSRPKGSNKDAAIKRRCVSTACIACRRRKSKCDGNTPSCAACASVYGTECVYDPASDHRRKGVYKEKVDTLKTKNSTLQTLVQAILNAAEEDVLDLVRQIRTCDNLDDVAQSILRQEQGLNEADEYGDDAYATVDLPAFETELSGKMGELRLENGSVRFLGGTSNLIYLEPTNGDDETEFQDPYQQQVEPLKNWTTVTDDVEVIVHLINMYFTWHYAYFTTLSKSLFYRDFLLGKPPGNPKRTVYCTPLLVNAMLALGCHFSSSPAGCADPNDPTTKGDAFFAECKRLIVENDEYEKTRLTTIQALCLMSVREAGCGREAKGWVYSGMAFRMALDMGLNLDSGGLPQIQDTIDEQDIDARRVTFWGCFLFDKCHSSYLGRLPQLQPANITAPKYDVFPDEEADIWSPYTDNGVGQAHSQPARTRTVALQISKLCEISSDLLNFFYHPTHLEKPVGKAQELKVLGSLQTRLEAWRKELPKELDAREGQMPNVLLMHMFFHLLYIHLFRPFLKYSPSNSPLPSSVSPRKVCIQAASFISKLMRLYKRTYGLRQICNIAVYMVHSACTIHLLNLPEPDARRDIIHGLKHLEEIAEDWLCARRTLSIISVLARKWKSDLPEEATAILARTDAKFGFFSTADVPSPKSDPHGQTPRSSASSPPGSQHHSPHAAELLHTPTSLSESLHSYSHPTSNAPPGVEANIALGSYSQPFPQQQINPTTVPPSTGDLPVSDTYHMAIPTSQPISHLSSVPTTLDETIASSSAHYTQTMDHAALNATSTSSSAPYTQTIGPTTMFGGVEMLVQNQHTWLRDQASLPLGFNNWMSMHGGSNPSVESFPGDEKRTVMTPYSQSVDWASYNFTD